MSERPDNLEEKFGQRVGVAWRTNPEAGEGAWVANVIWEMDEYWVICQMSGKIPYDWEFAVECLGEEEEAGRFASFAKEFIPKGEMDAAALKSRFEGEFGADDRKLAWWSSWSAA